MKEKESALQRIKDKERYRQTKRKVKKSVTTAKNIAYRDWYEKQETAEGEKIIYKVGRQCLYQ